MPRHSHEVEGDNVLLTLWHFTRCVLSLSRFFLFYLRHYNTFECEVHLLRQAPMLMGLNASEEQSDAKQNVLCTSVFILFLLMLRHVKRQPWYN